MLFSAIITRHCEERSDEAIQSRTRAPGLLRFARNDGGERSAPSLRPVLMGPGLRRDDSECYSAAVLRSVSLAAAAWLAASYAAMKRGDIARSLASSMRPERVI